jgi:succinoglycan biosynthesis protein ExoL
MNREMSTCQPDDHRPLVAYFGHDSNEPTTVKRMSALAAAGARVVAFTFTRERPGMRPAERFENVHLGFTRDRDYLGRLPGLARGLAVALAHARLLRRARVIYARNIDMALVALAAKRLLGSRAAFAYEVLDIQRLFLGEGPASDAARAAERRILAAADLLVVSSPDFLDRYFLPRQNYRGFWRLLENKIAADRAPAVSTTEAPAAPPPWRIGWFGRLRCRESLEILCRAADRLGDRIFVDIRGLPSEIDLPTAAIEEAVAARPNMHYGGAFASPDDLPHLYGGVHFAWCVDFLDAGTNSDWLLPNRLYESGLFAVPALARTGTATARKASTERLGLALDDPLEESLVALLNRLDASDHAKMRASLSALPRAVFVDETDTRDLLASLLASPGACG